MSDKKRDSKQSRLEFHQIRNRTITDEETGEKKRFIYSNQMLLDAIKAALPDGVGKSQKKFIEYFPKDRFSEYTIRKIYKRTYYYKNLERFIDMMDYVNEVQHTNLSVETASIRVDKELSDGELDEINHLINISRFNDDRNEMDTKVKKIIENLSGKTKGEEFFCFKLEILKLYESVYPNKFNEMALVNAIDVCYKPKEFIREKDKFLKEETKETTKYDFTQDVILKIAVAYSSEMIKER